MEYYESEERSIQDSCSTSDNCSQGESSSNSSKDPSKKLAKNKLKKSKSIFSAMVSQDPSLIKEPLELKSWINYQIMTEPIEALIEKFKYRCCKNNQHSQQCEKKWEKLRVKLLDDVDEMNTEEKPLFVIRKRPVRDAKILLNFSQPRWIHRIVVQSLDISSFN